MPFLLEKRFKTIRTDSGDVWGRFYPNQKMLVEQGSKGFVLDLGDTSHYLCEPIPKSNLIAICADCELVVVKKLTKSIDQRV